MSKKMNREIENLKTIKELQGKSVEIIQSCLQEFSDELSVIETDNEILLDNLYKIDENEEVQSTKPIHIKRESVLDIDMGFSNEISILLINDEIRVWQM